MIHRHGLGKVPPKPHTAFYEGDTLLMEQCVTRDGFDGPFSILYFRVPPTDETRVGKASVPGFCPFDYVEEQPLHRRHIRTQDAQVDGDFLTARRMLLGNADLQISVCKPNQPAKDFFSNGDGDECWFAFDGGGVLESIYGILPFKKHDYVIIPKVTPYRLHPEGGSGTFLVFEGRPHIEVPDYWRNRARRRLRGLLSRSNRPVRLSTQRLPAGVPRGRQASDRFDCYRRQLPVCRE